MFDRTYLRAKAAMEGHKRGCTHCGWTGQYGDLRERSGVTLSEPPAAAPTGKCPACGVGGTLKSFRLWWGDGTAYEP